MRNVEMPGPVRRDTPWAPKTQQPSTPTPDTDTQTTSEVMWGAGVEPGSVGTDLSKWPNQLVPKTNEPTQAPSEPEPKTSTPQGTDPGPTQPGGGSGGGERGPSPNANPSTVPDRAPGPVSSPITEGQTFALPGERGFQPFQGSFFGRDLAGLANRRGMWGGLGQNLQTMLGEASRRGDLSRSFAPLGGGVGGGTVSAMGGQTLGDLLGPGDESEFMRRVGGYGGYGF